MEKGRKLLFIVLLLGILFTLLFLLPDTFSNFRIILAVATIFLFVLFIYLVNQWRQSIKEEEIVDFDMRKITK